MIVLRTTPFAVPPFETDRDACPRREPALDLNDLNRRDAPDALAPAIKPRLLSTTAAGCFPSVRATARAA
jgi:hypothetical protein